MHTCDGENSGTQTASFGAAALSLPVGASSAGSGVSMSQPFAHHRSLEDGAGAGACPDTAAAATTSASSATAAMLAMVKVLRVCECVWVCVSVCLCARTHTERMCDVARACASVCV